MTYFQPFMTQLGAQGTGRSPGPGFPPLTSQRYIANPGGQQYVQMQSTTTFFAQHNLQGTRIELNPNAVAYQSYTNPSPPGPNSQQYPRGGDQRFQGGDLRYQGGDQRFQGTYQREAGQMYQDVSKQYQATPLFRPYRNGPEVVRVTSPKPCLQRPMTPHTLKSPLQTLSMPAPSLMESTIHTPTPENTDGLTLSYPDDQSMFVKDSGQLGQGMSVPSAAAEDVFKAKASLYGIEICTKAERLATVEKQNKIVQNKLNSFNKNSAEVNGEKIPEMLFQMTHIEPEDSNESEDDASTSSVTEVSTECTTVCQQLIPNNDHGKKLNSSGKISNPLRVIAEEYNGCVVHSEGTRNESEEKSQCIEIPHKSWSNGSCANSTDECDSFITVQDASDEEIGIFRNYVLEALTHKSPQTKKNDAKQNSEFLIVEKKQYETMKKKIVDTEELAQENGDSCDSLVEEYVKSVIRKACKVVTKQCYLPRECRPAVKDNKSEEEENINNCNCKKTDYEKPDCVKENYRKLNCQNEADDTKTCHENKVSNASIKHQIDAGDSKVGPVEQISEPSLASSFSSSWAKAWHVKHSSNLDENSNYCNSTNKKVRTYHHDSESTEQSSDYSDSGGSQLNPITPEFKPRRYKNKAVCSMRPDAPVFQPLNVQTLPHSVKQKVTIMREVTCQTEEKEYREVASNTHRVKQVDHVSETVSCDTREVSVNTMDSCFSEDNEYFVDAETTFSEQGTMTESLDKKSIGVLVKPNSLDADTLDKESMTEPVTDYLESLIATQRELLHLRGDVCALEIKRQIHELERNKQLFHNMRGETLDNVVDDQITSLKIELNIIQNQVISYDAHLAAGNVFKSVPLFTVSIPVGGQNMITVNKVLKEKSTTKNVGTKHSFWDAHTPEEVKLLRDFGKNHPAKVTKEVINITCLKTDKEHLLDMDNIDDISLPEFSKTPPLQQIDLFDNTVTCRGDPVSNGVKNDLAKQIVDDSSVSVSVDSEKALSGEFHVTSDFIATDRTTFSTSDSMTENNEPSKLACRSASAMLTVNNSCTLSSSVLTTGTQSSNITTFSSGSSVVSKAQSSNITTSNGSTTVSSLLGPVPASCIPVSVCNASNSGSIMTNTISLNTQSLASAQLAPKMTRPPLLATPRIIPGQQAMVLYPQGHPVQPNVTPYLPVCQSQPSLPSYRQVQTSIPYTQVYPSQDAVPSFPVIANMRTPLLPQPPLTRVSTSAYQGNPLFQSTLTGQTSQSLGVVSSTIGQTKIQAVPSQKVLPGQISNLNGQQSDLPDHMNSTTVQEQRRGDSPVPSSNAMPCAVTSTDQTSQIAATLDRMPVDPELHQAVIKQLRQAYPNLAADPVWLEAVGLQQTMVLQKYIDASKNVASDKSSNNTVQQTSNLDPGIDSQKREESSKLFTASNSQVSNGDFSQTKVVLKQKSVDKNCAVIPHQPPGLASQADTDQSWNEKFENYPENSMKDLDGEATSFVKTISDLTKINRNETKAILPGEQKETIDSRTVVNQSSVGNKISQKPKSLLDNFKRVEKPVVPEPKVSTVYPDSFEKEGYSTSKDSDLNTTHSNALHKSKNIPPRQMPVSESTKACREAFRSPTPTSVGGEDWEDYIDPNPKPFQHDFRKVRPAEKTKTSWMAKMPKTNLPPGLPFKKPKAQSTTGKDDWWDTSSLGHGSPGSKVPYASIVNYSQKVEQWLNLNQPSSNDVLVRNKTPEDSGTVGQSGSLYSSWRDSTSRSRGEFNNRDDFDLPNDKDVGEGMALEGSSGMAVIPLTSKAMKITGDLNCVSDEEGEDWHQVSKKKKEKKKSEAERPRQKSGSDASGTKSNNFEKLIAKLSEVFTTLSRERIIELITEVRKETKGLSGMNMKQIINMSRQVFMAKRHYYQTEPKQKHTSPTPTAQKRLSPLPIVGMTAMPGPGKTYNFKPLSMSVIQASKDIPLMDDEEDICVICHDALLMEETKTLECGHVFHTACIKQWVFGQERTCPNCRRLALFPEEFPRLGK